MKFDLVHPCVNCPFRRDVPGYITPARVTEIERSLDQGVFPCHKTVDYDRMEDEEDQSCWRPTGKESHCAGALILLEKLKRPSNYMRVMERLRLYNWKSLSVRALALVFDSFDEMRAHMKKGRVQ